MNNDTYVLYHASCPDGFGAAYAAWLTLGDGPDYLPVQYGQAIPPTRPGAKVYVVDFSYRREELISLAQRSNRVVVLDHHKTARESLDGLIGPGLSITFDMSKSGAVLAWEHFHPGEPLPRLLAYVQDRDLWRWEMPGSREISAVIASHDQDFVTWDALAFHLESDPGDLVAEGQSILRAKDKQVSAICGGAWMADVGGYRVPTVNSPLHQSEVGEELCSRYPDSSFAAVFFHLGPDEQVWSLRSRNGFDVSEVASHLGGGGHRAAAGFKRKV